MRMAHHQRPCGTEAGKKKRSQPLFFASSMGVHILPTFFLISSGAQGLAPHAACSLFSDLEHGPIAMLVLLVLRRLPVGVERFLQAAGGFLLLYLAWAAFSQIRTRTGEPRFNVLRHDPLRSRLCRVFTHT